MIAQTKVKLQKRKKPDQLWGSYRTAERKKEKLLPGDRKTKRDTLSHTLSVCVKMTYKITHLRLNEDIPQTSVGFYTMLIIISTD